MIFLEGSGNWPKSRFLEVTFSMVKIAPSENSATPVSQTAACVMNCNDVQLVLGTSDRCGKPSGF